MPFINALTYIPPVPDGGGWKITPERIWIENRPASQTPAEQYLLQYAAENARLRAALEWYLADDARMFENGILGSVDDRPAKGALK